MKRIEKFVLILSIVTAIKFCATPIITLILKQQISSAPPQAMANAAFSLSFLPMIELVLINMVCGIWLYFESKDENLSRWVWLIFGLALGLQAVIMFYLYMLFIESKYKLRKSDESVG